MEYEAILWPAVGGNARAGIAAAERDDLGAAVAHDGIARRAAGQHGFRVARIENDAAAGLAEADGVSGHFCSPICFRAAAARCMRPRASEPSA